MTQTSSGTRTSWRLALLAALASVRLLAQSSAPPEVATSGAAVVYAPSAALLMSGQEGGDLPMNLLPLADPCCGREPTAMTVWVEIGGGPLAALVDDVGGELHIVAYVLDDAGGVVDRETRRLWIEPARHSVHLLDRGLKVALRMQLPTNGAGQIRVLAQWPNGPFGVRVRPLNPSTEPRSQESKPQVAWPPLIPQPVDDWAINHQPAPGRRIVPRIAGWLDRWVPAARPVLRGPTDVYLAVPEPLSQAPWLVRLTPQTGGPSIDVPTEDRAAIDAPEHPAEATATGEPKPADTAQREQTLGGCVLLALRIDPSTLPEGIYKLTASVEGGEGNESAPGPDSVPFVEAILGNPTAGPNESIASSFGEPDARDQETQSASTQSEARATATERTLRAGYREALRLAAESHTSASQAVELASFEETAFAALESRVRLEQMEARALASLSGDSSSIALTTALLHASAARRHQQNRRVGLVRHSLLRAHQLLHLAETDSAEIGEAAGSIGAWALRHGYIDEARELLRLADDLAPTLEDSQLLLAALEEKSGQHQAVLRRLGRLVSHEGYAASAEARLRYAVNLLRVGRTRKAQGMFEQIISGTGATWVLQMATQELVRLQRRDDPEQAEQIALQALARWPDEPGLLLLVSHLRESTGRYQAAREAIEPLADTTPRSPTPRSRYEQWPDVGHAALGPQLRQVADQQRTVLIERLVKRSGR